jgi:hypothetical protein
MTIPSAAVDDDQWHKVTLYQFWEKVKLQMDEHQEFRTLKQSDFVFGEYDTNLDVYVGGLPMVGHVFEMTQKYLFFSILMFHGNFSLK